MMTPKNNNGKVVQNSIISVTFNKQQYSSLRVNLGSKIFHSGQKNFGNLGPLFPHFRSSAPP